MSYTSLPNEYYDRSSGPYNASSERHTPTQTTSNSSTSQGRSWKRSAPGESAKDEDFYRDRSTSASSSRADVVASANKRLRQNLALHVGSYKKKSDPRLIYYNQEISKAAKTGDMDKCNGILSNIKKEILQPDAYSFAPIINYYVRRQDKENAWATLKQMKEEGVQPDEVIYNCLLNLYVKLGDASGISDTLLEMETAGIKPDVYTYTTVLNLYVRRYTSS